MSELEVGLARLEVRVQNIEDELKGVPESIAELKTMFKLSVGFLTILLTLVQVISAFVIGK